MTRPTGEAPCRRCGMPVLFRRGPTGRLIPLQRVRVLYTLDAARREPVPLERNPERSYWVNHFETCPHAQEFRHRAREGEAPPR